MTRSPPRLRTTLAQILLFRTLDTEALRRLDTRCTWTHAAPKAWIVEHDDPGTDVYFLTHGLVRALIATASERDVIFTDIAAGEFFGELAAIDGKPRSASIRALTQATVACMPAAVFREVLRNHPAVAEQVLRLLAARVRTLTQRVHEFSALHVRHRIIAELLRRSRTDPGRQGQALVSPPPTQMEIAAHVSTRREMVAREMKAIERAGLLTRRRGALVLTDVGRLLAELRTEI